MMNMPRIYKSTITSKGQTTIPVKIRDELKLAEGDEIIYTPTENGYEITKSPEGTVICPCPHCHGTGVVKKEG